MKLKLIILALLPFQLAIADIYDCNGILTNKPCDSGKLIATEKPYQTPDPKVVDDRKRQVWLQNLETARIKAKEKFDLSINIELVRDTCNTESIAACREAIEKKEKEINELILTKTSIDEKKKLADVDAQKNNGGDFNKTTVTIIDDRDDTLIIGDPYISIRRPYRPNPYRPQYRPTAIPIQPTPYDPGVVPLFPTPRVIQKRPPYKSVVPMLK